jgi:hypothetical protein
MRAAHLEDAVSVKMEDAIQQERGQVPDYRYMTCEGMPERDPEIHFVLLGIMEDLIDYMPSLGVCLLA